MPESSSKLEFEGKRVALGVSGGIAAYKAVEVLRGLQRAGCEVRVSMTRHACEFIQPLTFRALSECYVIVDDYARDNPDPIAHITFSQTVDLLVIAPATANIIAKFAQGVADDFLTSTYLACTAPVLIAPAMNTFMWKHPATQRNLDQLRADGVRVIEPDEGEMACGTIGPGRLSEPERIVSVALEMLRGSHQASRESPSVAQSLAAAAEHGRKNELDLAGERILITAGATREPIDPVRFLSNRSSGRMGFAIARAAHARGAQVTVIAGVTTVSPPASVRVIRAVSSREMHAAVMKEVGNATIFVSVAAVADYRPAKTAASKIKKSNTPLTLTLEPTEDILTEAARSRRDGQLIIGFAAETNDLLACAREKLWAKHLDAVIANDISRADAGFDSDTTAVMIIRRDREAPIELPLMPKPDAADRILDEIVGLRRKGA